MITIQPLGCDYPPCTISTHSTKIKAESLIKKYYNLDCDSVLKIDGYYLVKCKNISFRISIL